MARKQHAIRKMGFSSICLCCCFSLLWTPPICNSCFNLLHFIALSTKKKTCIPIFFLNKRSKVFLKRHIKNSSQIQKTFSCKYWPYLVEQHRKRKRGRWEPTGWRRFPHVSTLSAPSPVQLSNWPGSFSTCAMGTVPFLTNGRPAWVVFFLIMMACVCSA